MKVECRVDTEERLVTLTVSGALTNRDLLSLGDELRGSPDLQPDFALLVDLRDADGRKITSEGVLRLAQQPLILSKESRRAVVVPSQLGHGMARMYDSLSEPRGGGMRVFHNIDAARQWLLPGTGPVGPASHSTA